MSLTLSCLFSFTASAGSVSQHQEVNANVDAATFNGFKLYRLWCARCHGTFGQGLAAPDLTVSLNQISRETFMSMLTKPQQHLPDWSNNAAVVNNRDDIYRYLEARASGNLGSVHPIFSR